MNESKCKHLLHMRMTNVVVISGKRGCLRPSTFSCSRHFSVYIKLNHSGVAPLLLWGGYTKWKREERN